MKTKVTLALLLLLFITNVNHAQTISFPVCLNPYTCYECNVFKPGCPNSFWGCPGTTIKTTHGSPDYSSHTVGKVVRLTGTFNVASGGKSEGFIVSHPFKSGYRYTIKVGSTAQEGNRTPAVNPTKLFMQLTNSLAENNSAGCGESAIPAVTGDYTNPMQLVSGNTEAFIDDTRSINIPVGKSYSQLFLYSNNVSTTGSGGILIQYIDIFEHRPEFVLSPAAVNLGCGDQTAQVFTVQNPAAIGGAITYTWKLGAAPNGWLYNGSPAPETVTTTANSISLSPVCMTGALHSVAVEVYINGTLYNTYTAAVNYNTVISGLTISGPEVVCSSASYEVSNLPCAATVTWSATPAGIANLTPNGSTVTVTKVGTGVITLKALINGACSLPDKRVQVGAPAYPVTIIEELFDPYLGKLRVSTPHVPGTTAYKWYLNGELIQNSTSRIFSTSLFPRGCPNTWNVTLQMQNSCGISGNTYRSFSCSSAEFAVFPNPARSNVTLTFASEPTIKSPDKWMVMQSSGKIPSAVMEIRFVDVSGRVQLMQRIPANTKTVNISTNSLPPGNYILSVLKNGIQESKWISIHE